MKKSKASSDRDLTYQSGERVASPCVKNAPAKETNYVINITQASEMLFESASGLKKAYGMIDYLLRQQESTQSANSIQNLKDNLESILNMADTLNTSIHNRSTKLN